MQPTKTFVLLIAFSLFIGTFAQFEGVCTAASRNQNQVCTEMAISGCVCYNNRTCVQTYYNPCSVCDDTKIFSANPGKCPATQNGLCPINDPFRPVLCTKELYQACVCTNDGKCEVKSANKCTDCQNDKILAIYKGNTCPATNLQKPVLTNPGNGNKEVVCTPVNPLIACAAIGEQACATFKDGSKREILANACTCQNSNIVKYTYGACPLQTPTKFTPKKCPNYNGALVKCSSAPAAGCVGYKNGTYAYRTDSNTCMLCAVQGTNVVSFNEGEKCPVLSNPTPIPAPTRVVCPAVKPLIQICPAIGTEACATYKDGSKKNILANACSCRNSDIVEYTYGKCALSNPNPPKQCNYADAYQCPATSSNFCPLYYVEQSCVCYKDGSCKTVQGGNRCFACGDKNAVSVTEGKACPTTCSLSSTDKLKAAQAKVSAALKKLQEAQANVEKCKKEYNTAIAELNALLKN